MLSTGEFKGPADVKSDEKLYLTHVKQMHADPILGIDVPKSSFEKMALSQFKVVKTILQFPNAAVLDESLFEDLIADDLSPENQKKRVEALKLFPKKELPTDYADLDPEQKKFIVLNGGAITLLLLGKLTHVYKTYNSQFEYNAIWESFRLGRDVSVITETREKLAISLAKRAAGITKKQHVLLIYGAMHDFVSSDSNVIFTPSVATISVEGLSVKNIITKLQQNPDDPTLRLQKAIFQQRFKHYESAFEDFAFVRRLQPENRIAMTGMQECEKAIFENAEKDFKATAYADALKQYQFLNQFSPSSQYTAKIQECIRCLTKEAAEYESQLKYLQAYDCYSALIKVSPSEELSRKMAFCIEQLKLEEGPPIEEHDIVIPKNSNFTWNLESSNSAALNAPVGDKVLESEFKLNT